MKHVKSLDSLRGLAAVSVYCGHMWLIDKSWFDSLKPWFFFTAGGEAVFLFFVLSGFVLTSAYEKEQNFSYIDYVIRRILRIYPAYYFALVIVISSFILLKPTQLVGYSGWFNSQFPSISLDRSNLLDALLLVTKSSNSFDCVVWTLTYEVIISVVLLPLLWKYHKTTVILLVVGWSWLYYTNKHPLVAASCFYTLFFYMGMMTYRYGSHFKCLAKLKFLPIYLALYAILYFAFGSQLVYHEYLRNITSGIGSVGFILLALYSPKVTKFLEHKVLLFYGKISYSFYLLHMPLTFILIYSLRNFISLDTIRILVFIIASILAYASYLLIEKPFMSLGKMIKGTVKPFV